MKLVALAIVFAACAPPQAMHVPDIALTATSGPAASYPRDLAAASYTVFVFFSKDCECFGAHQARLHALVERFGPRGVRFVIVDSEVGTSLDDDVREARDRGLAAIYRDPGGKLARALGARFATYSVVVDPSGRIRYHGGIDNDQKYLRDDSTPFLADALDDLTAGREPRRVEGKTLGCALQLW